MTVTEHTLRLACSAAEPDLARAHEVSAHLGAHGVPVEVVVGDGWSSVREGRAELALGPWSGLPVPTPGELEVVAVLARSDARDTLIAEGGLTLGELPAASVIAVASPLRVAQLAALGLDWQLELVSDAVAACSQIGTDYAGVVLALAEWGTDRARITEVLDPLQVLPAPAQGAWVVVARAGADVPAALALIEDPVTRAVGEAERGFAEALGAGFTVGALAEWVEGDGGDEIWLRGVTLTPDGDLVRLTASGPPDDPGAVGRRLAQRMEDDGLLGAQEKVGA